MPRNHNRAACGYQNGPVFARPDLDIFIPQHK